MSAVLGPLGFSAPWLLLGLAALPALWLLLRTTPPAARHLRFPGVALLIGLGDRDSQPARTPWWLLLLRMLALAAAIVGFAGPVLHPAPVPDARGPLLIVADASWASARDWPERQAEIRRALDRAGAAGRPVALLSLTRPPVGAPVFAKASHVSEALPGLVPMPWEPAEGLSPAALLPEGRFDTLWLSDGLARPGREALAKALLARGRLAVWQPEGPVLALGRPVIGAEGIDLPLLSSVPIRADYDVTALGPDPAGAERVLARATVHLQNTARGRARFTLPPELRNRIARFEIAGIRSAGAVSLTDDSLKRRKVALVSSAPPREGLALLSPLHYLREALAPSADLIGGTLSDALAAEPDAIILADAGKIPESAALSDWVEKGGVLIRFAGPRLAAGDSRDDDLLPVPLRAGGRSIGGAMSWGAPRRLAPFPPGSPFAGLPVPKEVTVREQVMAEPGPGLAARTIAALEDGTPLVTRALRGKGEIVLFHVTANADWSSLPLSGLFPGMLSRLVLASGDAGTEAAGLSGRSWVPAQLIDAFGALSPAGNLAGVPGRVLEQGEPGPDLPPGIYRAGERSVALNALARGRELAAPLWPAGVTVSGAVPVAEKPLAGWFLAAALALLLFDIPATLLVSGRLRRGMSSAAVLLAAVLAGGWGIPSPARAEAASETMAEARAVDAAGSVTLAFVPSGDVLVDREAMAGLRGLGSALAARSSVEPGEPMRLDLARDDLALFTLIYWPVTATEALPTPAEYLKLNRFLQRGGMILFDTRDADVAGLDGAGGETEAGQRLRLLAAPLDIPPLEPVPQDHVLTRSFYLLQDFPGRYDGKIWVAAPEGEANPTEGRPFGDPNDGVSPVVIGGNDWAAAWAVEADGMPMFPVGRGLAGERQREIAFRFGINLVMYVLTGNYKSDQVHVPALLERLGE